jgi:hypothetical protein
MASANSLFLPKRMADAYFSGSYKLLLVSSLPTETDLDTFDFRNDITNEVAASGTYATGGAAVTCSVGAVDTVNNRVPVTFGNPATFTSATISAVGAWIYKAVGTAATDELVWFMDFGGTITSTLGSFSVTVNSPLYVNR